MTRFTKIVVLLVSGLTVVAFAPVASAADNDGRRPGAAEPTAIGRFLETNAIGRWSLEAPAIKYKSLEPNARYRPGALKLSATPR